MKKFMLASFAVMMVVAMMSGCGGGGGSDLTPTDPPVNGLAILPSYYDGAIWQPATRYASANVFAGPEGQWDFGVIRATVPPANPEEIQTQGGADYQVVVYRVEGSSETLVSPSGKDYNLVDERYHVIASRNGQQVAECWLDVNEDFGRYTIRPSYYTGANSGQYAQQNADGTYQGPTGDWNFVVSFSGESGPINGEVIASHENWDIHGVNGRWGLNDRGWYTVFLRENGTDRILAEIRVFTDPDFGQG